MTAEHKDLVIACFLLGEVLEGAEGALEVALIVHPPGNATEPSGAVVVLIKAVGGSYGCGGILLEMLEDGFHLPARIAEPRGLLDLPEQVAVPEYATAVGLVLYAAKARKSVPAKGNLVSKLRSMFAGA